MKRFIISALVLSGLMAAPFAIAQMGGGISVPSFFKKVGDAVNFTNSAWTLGSVSSRIAGIYADNLDVTNAVIGGTVTGDLDISGNVSSTKYIAGLGSNSAPSISFTGDPDTGLFQHSGARNRVDISVAGVWQAAFAQDDFAFATLLRPFTTNLYDFGSSQYSWKNVYSTGTVYAKDAVVTGGVTSSRMAVTAMPAAGAGLQPVCLAANGAFGYGAAGICPVSTIRIKDVKGPASYGLNDLLDVRFYDYAFKDGRENGRVNVGPVAEELVKTMPNLVLRDGKGEVIGYDYVSMIAVQGQAIKDLNARIDKLESRVGILERIVSWLKGSY